MSPRFEDVLRLREVIGEAERRADAYRRYFLDEAAYAAAEFSFAGAKLSFPSHESFSALLEGLDRASQAFFILRLHGHLCARERALTAADFLLPEERALQGEHIIYVRNYYTERAYEHFAAALTSPTVSYATDFTDACAAVAEGLADLCILPFRDEGWALFHSFSRMPEYYGLCLCALCTVTRTGVETMRLALCTRGCRIPQNAKKVAVELYLSSHDGVHFDTLQALSSQLSGKIVFAEAQPNRYTGESAWNVTYMLPSEAMAPFLLGRRLLTPDAELRGIYAMPALTDLDA